MLKKIVALGIALGVVLGCGTEDDETKGDANCNVVGAAGYDVCFDYDDATEAWLATGKTSCGDGTWGVAGTWTTGSLCVVSTPQGKCTMTSGSNTVLMHYITIPSGADQETHCTGTMKGTYTAP